MKKLYTLSFALLAFTFANAQNLVTNPSFDNGLTGWAKGPTSSYTLPTIVTAEGSDNSNSVQYIATATTGFYQEISIVGGSQLVISFWYKASGDGTDARIWSYYKDSSDVIVNQATAAANDPLRNNDLYLDPAATWTQKTITVTAPATATKLVLAVRAYNNGTANFDQFSVVQTLLDVKENEIAGLNIYPNPVSKGTLYITSSTNAVKSVVLFDVLGKQVLKTTTSNNSINVSGLKNGVYIIKITEDGKTDTQKLIIE